MTSHDTLFTPTEAAVLTGLPLKAVNNAIDKKTVGTVAGEDTTAKMFSVSVATVARWSQRFGTTGSAAALAMGGRRPYRLAGRRDWLLARIAEKPDLTLRAIRAELAADGVKVSYGAV